ncbi:adenosylmethionine decarboxylase [Brevibacillus dissolubilis]|uniref:adenosylmethionine decarboxylase n=1 Tax=Brevibacillus dissolubilis TaxID=1844116 RepID=UPI001116D482|nr:adenosylmethionine decarboxylase [Brevibacillus dissolubilis]
MDTTGRHIILDMWECNQELLKKKQVVEQIMVDAANESQADIREVIFHQFEPDGVSGIVVIAESHLSIHTFPEDGYASVDVYTCGDMDPHIGMEYLVKRFESRSQEVIEVVRGVRPLKVETPSGDLLVESTRP